MNGKKSLVGIKFITEQFKDPKIPVFFFAFREDCGNFLFKAFIGFFKSKIIQLFKIGNLGMKIFPGFET